MKKLVPPSYNSKRIEGLRVDLDDLELLIEIFRRDVGSTTLSDDHFEFESLEEFIAQRGTRPKMLEVGAKAETDSFKGIGVKFEGSNAWLHGTNGTPFHEAKEFLNSRRPWTFRALDPFLWFMVSLLSLVVISVMAEIAKKEQGQIPDWPAYILFGAIGLSAIGFIYRRVDFGLRLVRSHERGFWARNAEKIGLILVGAVISTGITWLSKLLSP
jgi:hypothetical protein